MCLIASDKDKELRTATKWSVHRIVRTIAEDSNVTNSQTNKRIRTLLSNTLLNEEYRILMLKPNPNKNPIFMEDNI